MFFFVFFIDFGAPLVPLGSPNGTLWGTLGAQIRDKLGHWSLVGLKGGPRVSKTVILGAFLDAIWEDFDVF